MYACLEACVMFRIALGKEEVSFNHRWLLRWNKFPGRERNPKNSVHKEQWQVICLSVQNLHQDWLCILISYYASLSHPYSQFAHLLNGESSVNLIGLLWKSDHPGVAQCLSSCIKYSVNISWHSSYSSTLPEVNSEFLGYFIKYPSFLFISSQYSGDSSFLECDPLHLTLCLPSQIPKVRVLLKDDFSQDDILTTTASRGGSLLWMSLMVMNSQWNTRLLSLLLFGFF